MKTTLTPIKYIGKKERQKDCVASTGLVWLPGQIHVVPTVLASKFLKHPDVWADATDEIDEDPGTVGLVVNSLIEDPNTSIEKDPTLIDTVVTLAIEPVDLPNLNGMTKSDIVAYGQRAFHQTLDVKETKEALISKVINLRNAQSTTGEGA